MSPQEEALWQAVTKKEYDKVEKLITDYPELVNAVNANGKTLLMRVVLALVPPLDLIRFIAKQPNLSFENQSAEASQTTMGAVLSTGRPDILEIFAKDPRIIFDGDQLAYVTAKKNLESASQSKVENYKKMLTLIREATIRHAVSTDDPNLLERLEKAGDDLSQELSDGKLPVRLITKESPAPKVKSWFQSQLGKNATKVGTHAESFFSHVQDMEQTQEKMDALDQRKLQKDMTLFGKVYDSTLNTMKQVVSTLSLTS
ncbi:Uncharacterised protein [Legionella steigerwaltii]|uniref:Uncharacterized protein n=1 Tax=Legionella steigerwaltii TaxID=460 RepID=A0A378LI25_9GAMM|nr:hypothetical protein [Legionella steigerwaltii]KTD75738.1 hypothetical protein Lstg_2417 [Legionella steigerwaltii]STY23751.1 Uncharacterised protein [Legionella steigerwaltii]